MEESGMTNCQYKGMLLDQLDDWERILEVLQKSGSTEAQKEVEKQIEKINRKLRF